MNKLSFDAKIPAQYFCLWLLLFACPFSYGASSKVSIEVGSFSPEYGKDWITFEIESFQQAHTNINLLQYTLLEPSRYRNPIEEWPRLAKNVIGIDSESGYETILLVERNMLVPIDDFLPDPDFHYEDFYDSTWEAVRYKGKTWGVPWTYWAPLLVIDKELFKEAGLINPPVTWNEFLEYGGLLTKDLDGDGKNDQWGIHLGVRNESLAYTVVSKIFQDGGYVMKNGRFDFSHPSFVNAFQFIGELLHNRSAAKIDNREYRDIVMDQSIRYGMFIVPNFDLPAFATLHSRYRIVQLPTDGERVLAAAGRRYFAIRRSTPEEERASWEFVKWMTRADISLPASWEIFPCRKSIPNRQDFPGHTFEGLEHALLDNAIALEPGQPVYNRREAMIQMVVGMAKPLLLKRSIPDLLPELEDELNGMIRPILPEENSLDLYR